MPDSATKRCNGCGEAKPVSEFSLTPKRDRRYPRSRCRECTREQDRKRDPVKHRERSRQRTIKLRAQVFAHYGTACTCCGTTENLTIDHVNGDGKQHPRKGDSVYRWLIENEFPDGYQALCMSCNASKGRGQFCDLRHGKDAASPPKRYKIQVSVPPALFAQVAEAALPGEALAATIRRLLKLALEVDGT